MLCRFAGAGYRRRRDALGKERPVPPAEELEDLPHHNGLVLELFAIASEFVPRRRRKRRTHMWTALRLRLFAVIPVTNQFTFKPSLERPRRGLIQLILAMAHTARSVTEAQA